jgi:hypothetical protein
MSYLTGKDISQWNNYVPGSEDFVILKIGGGDAGMYFDSKATLNYNAAVNAGKVVGGYWFAGGGDPVAEADYFCRGMAPYAENDLFALDWEIQHTDPVGWCLAFVNEVHAKTGVWPFIYLNISTTNSFDWSPVLANCGLWLAAPSFTPDQNAPVNHPYVLQQGAIVGGIDSDYGFLTVDQLKKYAYHAAQPAPPPPAPPVVVPPAPTETAPPVDTTPLPDTLPIPPTVPPAPQPPVPSPSADGGTPAAAPAPAPGQITPAPSSSFFGSILQAIINFFRSFFGVTK